MSNKKNRCSPAAIERVLDAAGDDVSTLLTMLMVAEKMIANRKRRAKLLASVQSTVNT